MAAAMCLRTPRTAMRSSPPEAVGEVAVRDPFPDSAERAGVPDSAARCTSSRVIEPSGPLPASAARLMPRSLASLRTGGFASAGLDSAGLDSAGLDSVCLDWAGLDSAGLD